MTRVVISRGMRHVVTCEKKERSSQLIGHVGAKEQKATTRASSVITCSCEVTIDTHKSTETKVWPRLVPKIFPTVPVILNLSTHA